MAFTRVSVLIATALLIGVTLGSDDCVAQTAAQGTTVVGKDTCAVCHEDLTAQFDRSAHGHLATFERQGQHPACESCHGPGGEHAEAGGDLALIRSFTDLSANESARVCLGCHRQDHAMEWAGSEHALNGVACTDCHAIHQSRQVVPSVMTVEGMATSHSTAPAFKGSLKKAEPELCYDCHQQRRAQFMSSSHHPVREGLMTCSSCHQVHGANQQLVRSEERVNDLCYTCHAKMQGPFVFEHDPVEESCLTCHDPHGTVAGRLLKQGEPFLCLQCHEMHFHNARVAPTTAFYLPSGGSDNPNGASGFQRAFGTRCTVCHNKIHGSDLPSQGVTGRGKALMR